MGEMGLAAKNVAAMIQGQKPYDKQAIAEAAALIRDHSGETLTALFPEGSQHPPSKTAEAVWSDWERFSALAEDLALKAENLGSIAASGSEATMPDGLRDAFVDLSQTCSDCHRDYRLPD